jgi:diguanylate cyclase (GGDEF)-like protein
MMDSILLEYLQHSKLFANVSLDSVEHLFESCERRNLERGDHLLEAGAENIHLYLILGGELRVYLQGRDMAEQAVLTRGDCVGEMSLLDGRPASALVLAAQDSEVLAIPHAVVWFLVDCSHGVARNLLAIVSGRVRDSNQALVSMQSRSLEFEEAGRVDVLTGMHNRRWLLEAFPRAMARCERDEKPVCLILADVDLFRDFNARFGYLTGDAVLRRMAARLADGLRAQDLIARYGGETFVLLLPQASLEDALPVAERLRELVAIGSGRQTGEGVTLSCGVAQMTPGETLEALISRADAALRSAKANGRDRVEAAA